MNKKIKEYVERRHKPKIIMNPSGSYSTQIYNGYVIKITKPSKEELYDYLHEFYLSHPDALCRKLGETIPRDTYIKSFDLPASEVSSFVKRKHTEPIKKEMKSGHLYYSTVVPTIPGGEAKKNKNRISDNSKTFLYRKLYAFYSKYPDARFEVKQKKTLMEREEEVKNANTVHDIELKKYVDARYHGSITFVPVKNNRPAYYTATVAMDIDHGKATGKRLTIQRLSIEDVYMALYDFYIDRPDDDDSAKVFVDKIHPFPISFHRKERKYITQIKKGDSACKRISAVKLKDLYKKLYDMYKNDEELRKEGSNNCPPISQNPQVSQGVIVAYVNDNHPYKIYKNTDGLMETHVRDNDGHRHRVKAKTMKCLYEKLHDIYINDTGVLRRKGEKAVSKNKIVLNRPRVKPPIKELSLKKDFSNVPAKTPEKQIILKTDVCTQNTHIELIVERNGQRVSVSGDDMKQLKTLLNSVMNFMEDNQ